MNDEQDFAERVRKLRAEQAAKERAAQQRLREQQDAIAAHHRRTQTDYGPLAGRLLRIGSWVARRAVEQGVTTDFTHQNTKWQSYGAIRRWMWSATGEKVPDGPLVEGWKIKVMRNDTHHGAGDYFESDTRTLVLGLNGQLYGYIDSFAGSGYNHSIVQKTEALDSPSSLVKWAIDARAETDLEKVEEAFTEFAVKHGL